jgi:hypothetical protein
MISQLEVIPRQSKAAQYEVVVNGDVFRAEHGAYGSATSRPGQTAITGTISPSERSHTFLVRHSEPLEFQIRGPVTKQVRPNVEGFSPTISEPDERFVGPPEGRAGAKPPPQAPAFGIPGRDAVPNERVKRGMPFADNLLADKTAVRNSRVGGILQWQANQNPGAELPVKAVLSANNPQRPLEAIQQVLSGGQAPSGTSGLAATESAQPSGKVVTFRISGQQAERLEQIEGATFFLEGTGAVAIGTVGVPVAGGTTQNGQPGGANGAASGGATTGSGARESSAQPAPKDRIISGVPDALLGTALFASGVAVLAYTSGGE